MRIFSKKYLEVMMMYTMDLNKEQSRAVEEIRMEKSVKGPWFLKYERLAIFLVIAGLVAFFIVPGPAPKTVIALIMMVTGFCYMGSTVLIGMKIARRAKSTTHEGTYDDLDEDEALIAFSFTVPHEKIGKKYIAAAGILFIGSCWAASADNGVLTWLLMFACMIPILVYAFMYSHHRRIEVEKKFSEFQASGMESTESADKGE